MSEEAGEYKTGRIKTGQMIPPKEQSPLLTGTPAQPQECSICKMPMREDENCGGDCIYCMADAGDPDCIKSVIKRARKSRSSAVATNKLVEHQAEAWCLILTDLVCSHGLDYKEPGKVAADQVRSFIKRKFNSLEFYKRRCNELQRIQGKMRDPERKMVCDILANGTTYEKGAQ